MKQETLQDRGSLPKSTPAHTIDSQVVTQSRMQGIPSVGGVNLKLREL